MSLEHSPARDDNGIATLGHNGSPEPIDDLNFWHALINEKAAAEFLGVGVRFMQALRQRGDGPPYRVISSRCLRYTRLGLRQWSKARTRTSTSDPGHEADIA